MRQVIRSLQEGADLHLQLAQKYIDAIIQAANAIQKGFRQGGKVLLFANNGSAADAQHIVAEFVGRFKGDRCPLAALALSTDTSILTAIRNDYGFEQVFSRQVRALGRSGDVIIAISTSGRSPNVLEGVRVAREIGLTTIGLTGGDGGELASMVDIPIITPSTDTSHPRVPYHRHRRPPDLRGCGDGPEGGQFWLAGSHP